MVDRKSDSAQVILTCAILLAIIIVIIALMLNNIIYATNVAYIGFMDGTKYEDQSIRQLTEKEALRSYYDYLTGGTFSTTNVNKRSQYMSVDYINGVNYLMNSKGKYVELKPDYTLPPSSLPTSLTGDSITGWNLAITDKDSRANYIIAAPPGASYDPPTVYFTNYEAVDGTNGAQYTVTEGQMAQLDIRLSHVYGSDITVGYVITPGTGTVQGTDYVGTTGTRTFSAGSTNPQHIQITTLDTGAYKPPRTFIVTLQPPTSGATLSPPSFATVTIKDNNNAGGSSSTDDYSMSVKIDAARSASDDKKVEVTVTVTNTGTSETALANVIVTLDATVTNPGNGGVSTLTFGPTTGEVIAKNGHITHSWIISTQNKNCPVMLTATVTAATTQISSPVSAVKSVAGKP